MVGDPEAGPWERLVGAICRQAIRDYRAGWHAPGYPDATAFVWAAGLLHTDGSLGAPDPAAAPAPLPPQQACYGGADPTSQETVRI